ncbi:MAG: transposase [Thiotrichales bacterium]|nr:MAG: transposase [Thiotrichales bacterium]
MPKTTVCHNGPEFTCKAMFFRAKTTGTKLHFIQPGKPTQNAFIESLNGMFREYRLDMHRFARLVDTQSPLDDWRSHFNHVSPHRSTGKIPRQCSLNGLPDMITPCLRRG